MTRMNEGEDRRSSGGRREGEDERVPLREHVEMLIDRVQTQIESSLASLELKLTEHLAAEMRHNLEIRRTVAEVEGRVDLLEKVEDRREGGKVVLGRGWAVFYALATLTVAAVGVAVAVVVALA